MAGIDLNTVEEEEEEEDREAVNIELWHACAGPVVSLPKKGSVVVYFPQGHLEQIGCHFVGLSADALPPHVFSRVVHVTLMADVGTDEVYAQLSLMPLSEEERQSHLNFEEEGDGEEKEREESDKLGPTKIPHMFCKTLTASDTSTHGGFSVPRRAAEDCFPPLDYKQQRPTQELVAKDLHGTEWRFRHIYRGQPRRHLLTTGWSSFVNKKKLVSGDAVLFLRGDDGELRLGIRRAVQLKSTNFPAIQNSNISNIAQAISKKSLFHICYNPRDGQSEFIVPYWKFMKSFNHPISIGTRFKMNFESEDASERRYNGLITGISDMDPLRWPGSKWRCLLVRWDENGECIRQNRVSPWEIELTGTVSQGMMAPNSKRLKPCTPTITGNNNSSDYLEPSGRFQKVLQGQEMSLGFKSPWDRIPITSTQPFCAVYTTGASLGFPKVLQGQEILPPYNHTTTPPLIGTIVPPDFPFDRVYKSISSNNMWGPQVDEGIISQVSPSIINSEKKDLREKECRIFGFLLKPVMSESEVCEDGIEMDFVGGLNGNCATVKCP
uniref:Auxin response factor n=1 Tax=Juncus prismatocarpus subsp. leschenaultii TaxID=308405 RepID=D9N1B4_9POAL|nr:auxin response factor 3 [Juncus prismatocarpus subsp. leschenaultii]